MGKKIFWGAHTRPQNLWMFKYFFDNLRYLWRCLEGTSDECHQPPRKWGGLASLEITLYDSQQNTLHIAKHTPLLSVPHGTHTLLQGVPGGMGNCHMLPGHTIDVTRCACHECGKVRLSGHTIDVTRCDSPRGDKVHLGHVYCGGTLQLGLQSSRSRPRGWK